MWSNKIDQLQSPDASKAGYSHSLSAHLTCHEEYGLVSWDRRGKFVYYAVADPHVAHILGQAEKILGDIGANVFRCTHCICWRRVIWSLT
jgi:hypothetical protein